MYLLDNVKHRVLAGEYQSIRLRGISQPVSTYRVEQLNAQYQKIIEKQYNEILQASQIESDYETD